MSFVSIEKFAAVMPCQFCGQSTNQAFKMCGCKERKYSDVTFIVCDNCMKEMVFAIGRHFATCKNCNWYEPHKCRMGQPFDPLDKNQGDKPMCEYGRI